jgi:hypothetical protein
VALLAAVVGCGSSAIGPDGGQAGAGSGNAGTAGGAGQNGSAGTGGPPAEHRAQAVACPATAFPPRDGGVVSCATDSDCVNDGSYNWDRYCLQHTCNVDQCLTDGDCASDQVCGCADQFGGNGFHMNRCVQSACHVDADCGPGGYCSPATNNYCSSLSGYHCHKTTDTCRTAADCPQSHDGGVTIPRSCAYVPELDRWACAATVLCAG